MSYGRRWRLSSAQVRPLVEESGVVLLELVSIARCETLDSIYLPEDVTQSTLWILGLFVGDRLPMFLATSSKTSASES